MIKINDDYMNLKNPNKLDIRILDDGSFHVTTHNYGQFLTVHIERERSFRDKHELLTWLTQVYEADKPRGCR